MRLASPHLTCAVVLAGLMAGSAAAAPTISTWSLSTDDTQERIELRWSEAVPVEMNEFAQARELVLVLPGAHLQSGTPTRFASHDSPLFDRARLQQVTLPHGESGVQLTLQLKQWVEPVIESDETSYRLAFPIPEALRRPAPAGPQGRGLELTDARLAELDAYGALGAPATGAGQDAEQTDVSAFYVPPNVAREGRTIGVDPDDVGAMAVESKLNEFVRRVDFQGTSLENVLRLISEEAELNILLNPSDVAGMEVTLRLRNVTLRQMLDAILKANGLGYAIESGGIVRIVPRDQVKATTKETVVETIPINWVDAQEVAAALEPLIDEEDGSIQVLAANNIIIVRDVPETVNQIQEIVQLLDIPEKQVLIELRLVNMSESARRAVGVRTGVESVSTEERFLRDNPEDFFNLSEFVNANRNISQSSATNASSNISQTLEEAFGQILGGGATGSLDNEFTSDLTSGATESFTDTLTASTAFVPSSRATAGLLATGANAFRFSTLGTVNVFGADYDVDFAINAEENRGEAVTLSNPIVLSLNNQEATVEIRRQIPYQSAVNSDQGSVATIEFVDVGTEVTILPRITNNGFVQMQIQPQQTLDTGERAFGVPVTDERNVTSSVIVRDEQTVALGGLREFESTSSENGVPFLMRLPVLSWLFKNQSNSQNKTELVLFVTPEIVKDPTPTNYQQALYDKIDYNWDLPDYYFDEVMPRSAPGEENDPRIPKP